MTRKAETGRIVIVLPAKLRDRVIQVASDDDVSASAIGRRAIKAYVEAREKQK